MKKMMKRMLALMVVMCMFAPMTAWGVTTQNLKVSITGESRFGGTKTVTVTSGAVSASSKLANEVFTMLGSVHSLDWHTYEQAAAEGRGENQLWIFDDTAMHSLMEAGWSTYQGNPDGWSAWVDANFSGMIGDDTLKNLIGDLDSTVGQLPAVNTDYSLTYSGYTVTVRVVQTYTDDGGSSSSSSSSTSSKRTFADVHDVEHWSESFVDYVVAKGLFDGTGEKTFHPDMTLTRAMVMTVLASYSGVNTVGGGTWYEKSLQWAIANGISDGSNPNDNITREQLAVMLWAAAGRPAVEHDLSAFVDDDEISVWAMDAMEWVVKNGVMEGRGNGVLDPKGMATRAEAAVMLMNFCEAM